MGAALSWGGIAFMRVLALWPLPLVRALGWLLGGLLHALVASRRKVVRTNLLLCFPKLPAQQLRGLERKVFIYFAQAWLDRGWLWHAAPQVVAQRLQLVGNVQALAGNTPLVLFAPHFVGLDAGWTALTQALPRQFTTIYTNQANAQVDAWILQGRQRFGGARLFGRADGVREIASSLKEGAPLYLLPDMDFGDKDSVFVPFFGTATATVPSLHRFAKLGRAQVVSVFTRMTAQGYEVQLSAPWVDFPSGDMLADTQRMNQALEAMIAQCPAQYYWVHKRFKTRPAGEAGVY
jgi:Kdo2-lipid IVA lauroyltransferase/acyltransferase